MEITIRRWVLFYSACANCDKTCKPCLVFWTNLHRGLKSVATDTGVIYCLAVVWQYGLLYTAKRVCTANVTDDIRYDFRRSISIVRIARNFGC